MSFLPISGLVYILSHAAVLIEPKESREKL